MQTPKSGSINHEIEKANKFMFESFKRFHQIESGSREFTSYLHWPLFDALLDDDVGS